MGSKRNFVFISLCVALVVFISPAEEQKTAETGHKRALELSPSGVLEVDILQSLAEDDKTGSAGIGRLETGVEASAGDRVAAGLFLELGDDGGIGLFETWFTFKPVDALSLTAGQVTMPFGEYATKLMTDPLVMCGYEHRDATEIRGAETIFPGVIAGIELAGFSGAVGVYNSSYSERLEACAVKMAYSLNDALFVGVSSRFETGKRIDFDASLAVSPTSFLVFHGEVYASLHHAKSDKRLLGIHSELDILPLEPLVLAFRFGKLTDDNKNGSGAMQLGGCVRYSPSDHITFGIEANVTTEITGGKTGKWDALCIRIGCAIE